jgi:hypothetical protein
VHASVASFRMSSTLSKPDTTALSAHRRAADQNAILCGGKVPGAVELDKGLWRFDERRLRNWIRTREQACLSNAATGKPLFDVGRLGTPVFKSADVSLNEAYERALALRLKRGGKRCTPITARWRWPAACRPTTRHWSNAATEGDARKGARWSRWGGVAVGQSAQARVGRAERRGCPAAGAR